MYKPISFLLERWTTRSLFLDDMFLFYQIPISDSTYYFIPIITMLLFWK